jgi:predicted O-methyltransferase YrrM
MTTLDQTLKQPAPTGAAQYLRLAPALFAGTLFLSALLLFAVQPMFTKMVLPRLGGAPTVWSVAMVFFQAALLAGYAYAHLLIRLVPLGVGALVHLLILAAAATTLPIGIALGFETPPTSDIALWLIALFGVSIGLPFAALSASAPLLQGWFAASGHPQAGNPYVLYAASNLGSFAALIAYPIVIEPWLTLNQQTLAWSAGFAVLAILVVAVGFFIVGRPSLARSEAPAAPVPMRDRLAWIALAAIPAGLVIAVTSHITTDVAAAPFLWVVPLALYLLTFVGVFRERPWIPPSIVAMLVPFVIAPLAITLLVGQDALWAAMIALNLLAFFLLAILCHGELYRRRPSPARLTEFYLLVSVGGVIGGIFAAVIAPHIFSRIYEYPILIVAAVLALPGVWSGGTGRFLREAGPALLLALAAVSAKWLFDISLPKPGIVQLQIVLIVLGVVMLLQRRRPARFASLVVLAFVISGLWIPGYNSVETVRSFFGVHRVLESAEGYRLLIHGTTIHGAQRMEDNATAAASPPEPLTYYYFGGPISQTIEARRAANGGLGHVAVIGLGSGSLACHRRDRETWTFFEIDPESVRIARDPRLFSFLSRCAPDAGIVLGDARLTLAASRERYDLIIIDAFSSDAIPIHLLTREAVAGYLSRLNANGVLVMHISNRHMELARVVAAIGAAEGLVTYVRQDDRKMASPPDYKMNAIVAALARSPVHLGDLPQQRGWAEIRPDPKVPAWTDDYSDIVSAIIRMKFGR